MILLVIMGREVRGKPACSMEYVTVWDLVEQEQVDKVVCETEFREICNEETTEVCRVEALCETEERMVCEDSVTTKCGPEAQLVNQTLIVNECRQVLKEICEYEWVGEGKTRVWTPVEGSCVEKPFEECGDVEKLDEEIVEKEVCREIPIEDCHLETMQICDEEATREVCEDEPLKTCEVLPHEECHQVTEKVPQSVSRKVAQLVCQGDEAEKDESENEDHDYESDGDNDDEVEIDVTENEIDVDHKSVENQQDNVDVTINEIFGINEFGDYKDEATTEEDIESTTELIDNNVDAFDLRVNTDAETTTPVPDDSQETTSFEEDLNSTETPTTESPERTEVSSQKANTFSSTEESSESSSSESTIQSGIKETDGSRIVFSDDELNKRNEILANRRNNNFPRIRTTTKSPKVQNDKSSKIFFPDS